MKATVLICIVITAACLSGCLFAPPSKSASSLLLSEAYFLTVNERIFPPAAYDYLGGGMRGGSEDIRVSAIYRPKDPQQKLALKLDQWHTALSSKDAFSGHGEGGDPELYYSRDWENDERAILVDVTALKNGHILVTAYEVLR